MAVILESRHAQTSPEHDLIDDFTELLGTRGASARNSARINEREKRGIDGGGKSYLGPLYNLQG